MIRLCCGSEVIAIGTTDISGKFKMPYVPANYAECVSYQVDFVDPDVHMQQIALYDTHASPAGPVIQLGMVNVVKMSPLPPSHCDTCVDEHASLTSSDQALLLLLIVISYFASIAFALGVYKASRSRKADKHRHTEHGHNEVAGRLQLQHLQDGNVRDSLLNEDSEEKERSRMDDEQA